MHRTNGLCLAAVALLGCTGQIGEPPSATAIGGPGSPRAWPTPDPEAGACESVSPTRVWRLSHAQYDRTIADLLGDTSEPARGFEPQASGTGFRNGSDVGFVSETLAEQYMHASEAIAERAVASLDTLLPCTPADPGDRGCVRDLISAFGRRAFRKPITTEQIEMYLGLYDEGARTSAELGVQIVLEAMLQSPHFLYRFELGDERATAPVVPLTAHEVASELSYLLWDTMPDQTLLAKADDGSLYDPAELAAQLDRMLADPRAEHAEWSFFEQYFRLDRLPTLDKDPDLFPTWNDAVAASLVSEAQSMVHYLTRERADGTLEELLTADYTFVDETLADFYGISGVSGSEMQRVTLDPAEHAGLLTSAGVLAPLGSQQSSSPTQRGLFVRIEMLCGAVPDPPANVADTLEPPGEVRTTRDRYEAHVVNESCSACHQYMDPIGFGLESYDATGRFRTTENGQPIDASGEIIGTSEIDGTFDGARELVERLASSTAVRDCVALHFFRYALGRLEQSGDDCAIARIRERFATSGTRLDELLRALLESNSFWYRKRT